MIYKPTKMLFLGLSGVRRLSAMLLKVHQLIPFLLKLRRNDK